MESINGSRRIRPEYGILRIRRGQGVLPHVVPIAPPVIVDVSGRPIGRIDDMYDVTDPTEEENRQQEEMGRMVRLQKNLSD